VSRDPAESTSTSPLGLAVAEELAELAAELEDELLHALAASPTQATETNAAIRAPRRCDIVTIDLVLS
jgi:hypothetical protein